MNNTLVPFEHVFLIPHDWESAGLVTTVPGALPGYSGRAALVLTNTALYLCGPGGKNRTILYDYIREVTTCDLSGVVIARETAFGTLFASPREAYGVDITYEVPGGMRLHLRVLVYFYNVAAQWVAEIEDIVSGFYQRAIISETIVRRRPTSD